MITDAHIALIASIAGSDFKWNSPDAPAQIDSRHRQGLTMWLAKAQGMVCAACGDSLMGETMELCHIVASRLSGRGVMPLNIYVGHKGCNDDDAKAFGDILPIASLLRADVIVSAFPSRKVCLAESAESDSVRAERRNRRLAAI